MTPEFAAAVDPIFLYVLSLLERISRNEAPSPTEAREQVRRLFRTADSHLRQRQGWDLAQYALACWIDEVLVEAPWDGGLWWRENSLEFEFFNTQDRATKFFMQAKESQKIQRPDALEVFYVCVMLGFVGFYREDGAALIAEHLDEPPEIEKWAAHVSSMINVRRWWPRIEEMPRPIPGAPPLKGKFLLVGALLAGAVLAALNFCVWYLKLNLTE